MKRFITLLIAAGAFMTVQAQTSKDEARKVILGREKKAPAGTGDRDVILGRGGNGTAYPNSYPNTYPSGSRQAQIDRVNRQYDAKIASIRNNRTLSPAEKDRMIRQLENDRARKIREINQSDGGGYGKNGKNYKHKKYGKYNNPGKHLGWEKGKGNPHRNGGHPGNH